MKNKYCKILSFSFGLVILLSPLNLYSAEEEAPNAQCEYKDNSGKYVVKSWPLMSYGSEGQTRVFKVAHDSLVLLTVYPWYSRLIYIYPRNTGVSIVRFGSWPRGDKANKTDFCIGFYADGRILREYYTQDIAVEVNNVLRTSDHYSVFANVFGLKTRRNWYFKKIAEYFSIETVDNREIKFDLDTGRTID
jgi:hypothetical protein